MANPILLKSSSTAGAVPAAGSLTVRELALNTADGRLFTKTGAGSVVEFARKDAVPAGSGTSTGTNTGDNAVNTTYAADYRAANFVAGTHYLAPTGSAASLTGLTSGQVTTALGYTPSNPGGLSVSVIGTNTTATAGTTYVLTASLTLTLPTTPTAGLQVGIANRSAVATCVVGRNGSNIMGLAQDMTLDIDASLSLVFADSTRGWVLV